MPGNAGTTLERCFSAWPGKLHAHSHSLSLHSDKLSNFRSKSWFMRPQHCCQFGIADTALLHQLHWKHC